MAGVVSQTGAWIAPRRPKPAARIRLVCLPYAGGGASVFRTWQDGLPPEIDVCAVQLPGRENRLKEAPFSDLPTLVPVLADALQPDLDGPYALFGHSLGAFVAFELARTLAARGHHDPVHIFLSGQRAPQRPNPLPPVFELDDAEFLAELGRRYDAVPKAVLASPELMKMVLPLLRADFTMNDTYTWTGGQPLTSPITCFGATDDPESAEADLKGWAEHTRGAFSLRMFDGGHFFIQQARDAVLGAISTALRAC